VYIDASFKILTAAIQAVVERPAAREARCVRCPRGEDLELLAMASDAGGVAGAGEQNRHAAKDRAAAAHDYEVNLKSELEILGLHRKIDTLREQQWMELLAMQQQQIQLLTKVLEEKK
jgi:hypothetical protein